MLRLRFVMGTIMLLVLFLSFSFAQPSMIFAADPLSSRYSDGPTREAILTPDGKEFFWRVYDPEGLLLATSSAGSARGPGPDLVVASHDYETRVVVFTEPVPDDLSSIVVPNRYQDYDDEAFGRPHFADDHRFMIQSSSFERRLQEGDIVSSTLRLPYVSRFDYRPNQVVEERLWPDGQVVSTLTYTYGRFGLIQVDQRDFDGRRLQPLCAEFGDNGFLESVGRNCHGLEPAEFYEYSYDGLDRLIRVRDSGFLGSANINIQHEELEDHIVIELVVEGRSPQRTTLHYYPGNQQVHFSSRDFTGVTPVQTFELDLALWSYGLEIPDDPVATYFSMRGLVTDAFTEGILQFRKEGQLTAVSGQTSQGESHLFIEYDDDGRWRLITESPSGDSAGEEASAVWIRSTIPPQ